MSKVTTKSTLKEISAFPEFKGFGNIIAPEEGPMAEMTLEEFAGMACWNPNSIAAGYNRLLDVEKKHKVYYPLWTDADVKENAALKERYMIHFAVEKKAPFVILCAGGAYMGVASMIEAYPTCIHLNNMGYHAFTLNYRCGENAKAPNPLDDLAEAVKYILTHAKELNVDCENYAIGGFSAGGHLVSCFGTETVGWKHYGLPAPGAVFLAYPVVTMGEKTHELSREMFLGKENIDDDKMICRYSAEQQITPAYPPTFVWQCERDSQVPIENTRMLVKALAEHEVPYAYETFDSDAHGWGAGDGTLAEGWVERAVLFWQKHERR